MRKTRSIQVWTLVCLSVALCLTERTTADDAIDSINEAYTSLSDSERSDLVILPLLAKMDEPPAAVADVRSAMLLPTTSQHWASAEAWAQGAPQQALIAALEEVTREEDPRRAMVFGQPYGQDAGFDAYRIGLYTELGDPPLLARAQPLYMPKFHDLEALVHVEATRLANNGQPNEAIHVLIDWVFFSRQILDRELFVEVLWAANSMCRGLERIRDVAYVDFRGSEHNLAPDQITEIVTRLDEQRGYIGIDRMKLPKGNYLGVKQVIDSASPDGRQLDSETLGLMMARIGSTERPLRMFSEVARWSTPLATQMSAFDMHQALDRVHRDWEDRWPLPVTDPRLVTPFHFQTVRNDPRYMVIRELMPAVGVLFPMRAKLRVESVGTRASLAVLGFTYANGTFPNTISSPRPRFIRQVEGDPLTSVGRAEGIPAPLQYFVPHGPGYRTLGPRETPQPHRVNVVTGGENFTLLLNDDQFVVYSVGADDEKNWVSVVENGIEYRPDSDYLIWPPLTSLVRKHKLDGGLLD